MSRASKVSPLRALEKIGQERLAPAFQEHGLNTHRGGLERLSDADLKELGMGRIGDRAAFREAVTSLRTVGSVSVNATRAAFTAQWVASDVDPELTECAALLCEEGFDTPAALQALEMEDLTDMGIKRGHARLILRAARALTVSTWDEFSNSRNDVVPDPVHPVDSAPGGTAAAVSSQTGSRPPNPETAPSRLPETGSTETAPSRLPETGSRPPNPETAPSRLPAAVELAPPIHSADCEAVRVLFEAADLNKDGKLDDCEIFDLLTTIYCRLGRDWMLHYERQMADQVYEALERFDTDADGHLDFGEFFEMLHSSPWDVLLPKRRPASAVSDLAEGLFHKMDSNSDGRLDESEVFDAMESLFKSVDKGWLLEYQDQLVEEIARTFAEHEEEDGCIGLEGFTRLLGVHPWGMMLPSTPDMWEAGVAEMWRDKPMALSCKPGEMDENQLDEYLSDLFKIADANGDGVLQPGEMVKLLTFSGFELSATQVLDILGAADTNGDGVIQYEELIPVARQIFRAGPESDDSEEDDEEGSEAESEDGLDWAEIPEDELEDYIRRLFMIADENQDGVLQPSEFVELMRLSGLGFPDELILEGFQHADANNDGVVEVEELVPWLMGALKLRSPPEKFGFSPAALTQEQMEGYLKELFGVADTNGDGVLQPAELTKLLSLCGFELSSSQILDILEAADTNGDGVIEYEELVPVARAIICACAEGDSESDSEEEQGSEDEEGCDWTEIPEADLDEYLRKLFYISDENQDGVLQPSEFVALMRSSGLKFPDDLILQGFQQADTNKDGVVEYDELVQIVLSTVRALKANSGCDVQDVFSAMLAELSEARYALKPAQPVSARTWAPDPMFEAHTEAVRLFDAVDSGTTKLLTKEAMQAAVGEVPELGKLFEDQSWRPIWELLQTSQSDAADALLQLTVRKEAAVAVEEYLEAARCKAAFDRLSQQSSDAQFDKEQFADAYLTVWCALTDEPSSFDREFSAMVTDADFSDLVFRVEGKPIYYSRMVLCSRNDSMREMFKPGNKWSDEQLGYSGGQLREIVLDDVSYNAVLALLQFIYCGECPEMEGPTREDVKKLALDFHVAELTEFLSKGL